MRSVGGYTLGRTIARGAHGTVYEAVHENVASRRVAVKVLDTRDQDERTTERFIRESEILGRIDHPNVVRIHAAGIAEGGAIFIAMELVDGEDLGKLLARGQRTFDACRWLLGAARGLSALHAKGIVHRDVKPENVLVGRDGIAKICDLGVARDVNRKTALTAAGDVIGTFDYMSPEQAHGEPVDARTDVFGLGAVLYRILAGRQPYQAETALEALRLAMDARPPRPASGAPLLESLCVRAMDRDPSRRPADAADFALALERALAATPSEERVERVRAGLRRARPVFAILGLVSALALLAGVVVHYSSGLDLVRASAQLEALERATRAGTEALRSRKDVESSLEALERALADAAPIASASPSQEVATVWDRALSVAAETALVAGEPARARARARELAARAPVASSFLLAAQVELCLEDPSAAWEWLTKAGDDAANPDLALVRAAARFALVRDPASVAAVASEAGTLGEARPSLRGPLSLLAAEALLGAGDPHGSLAWTERSGETDPAGALAIAAEAHAALLEREAARLDLRHAEERLGGRHPGELLAIPSAEERVARARAAVLWVRSEHHAAAEALGRAVTASVGRRAGRLALRRAEMLSEGGDRGGAEDSIQRAERAGLASEAALVRARNRFAQGDAAGARHVAASAGPGRAAVLARARLALLAASLEPGPEATTALGAARQELTPLAEHDGDALALLAWIEEASGDRDRAHRGNDAVAHGGGPEALALAAREHLDDGDGASASSLLERARELVPASFAYRIGALAVGPRRFGGTHNASLVSAAREWLRAAAAASLADAPALVLLARLERVDGHAQRALAWAEAACRADPLDASAWLEAGLAALASGAGEGTRARRALETAARLSSTPDPEGLVGLVRVSVEDGEGHRAVSLAAGLLAGPTEPGLLDALALAGGADAAIARLVSDQRAREERDEAEARELDQLAFRRQEDLETCDRAVRLAPTARRFLARASAQARLTSYEEALLDEARATLLSGEGAFPLFERARSVVSISGPDARKRALGLASSDGDAAHGLASAMIIFAIGVGPARDKIGPDKKARLVAWTEARDAFEPVWEREAARPALWGLRAVLSRALGRAEEPERDFLFARAAGLEWAPSFEYLLARVSAATGDRRAAIAHLDLAIKGGFVHDRVRFDLDAGAEGWFGNDGELRRRLEQLAR